MPVASLIAASGALLGALIATALLLPANRQTAGNRQLALLMCIITAYLLGVTARHASGLAWLSGLQILGLSIFMLGPTLFLYTRARIIGEDQWRPGDVWHTLPLVLLLVDNMVARLAGATEPLSGRYSQAIGVFCYLQLIGYVAVSLARLRQARSEPHFSAGALRWLTSLLGAYLLLALPGLAFALGRWLFDAIAWPQQLWSITLMVGVSYLITFFALLDPEVFHGQQSGKRSGEPRYRTSSLGDDQARALWQSLEHMMQNDKPYHQAQLKIGELAASLEVPSSHLSQTINQCASCSFNRYLNAYRIQDAKALLRDTAPGERTMLDIALSVGFSSESAFYRHFRTSVGQTPRKYQQKT